MQCFKDCTGRGMGMGTEGAWHGGGNGEVRYEM